MVSELIQLGLFPWQRGGPSGAAGRGELWAASHPFGRVPQVQHRHDAHARHL